jgi:hypothetical protein
LSGFLDYQVKSGFEQPESKEKIQSGFEQRTPKKRSKAVSSNRTPKKTHSKSHAGHADYASNRG